MTSPDLQFWESEFGWLDKTLPPNPKLRRALALVKGSKGIQAHGQSSHRSQTTDKGRGGGCGAREASEAVGMEINPHMARKIHASLCHDADIPLEIVAGDAPQGTVGVGWEDLATLKKFYLASSKKKLQTAKDQFRQLQI